MLYGVFLPHSSLWITNYKNELYVFYEILGFNGNLWCSVANDNISLNGFIVSYSNDKNNFLQMEKAVGGNLM